MIAPTRMRRNGRARSCPVGIYLLDLARLRLPLAFIRPEWTRPRPHRYRPRPRPGQKIRVRGRRWCP